MPIGDLRELISILENQGKLLRITREVDPAHEVACVLMKAQRDCPGMAVYFEKIKGYPMPGVGNLYGSVENVLTALGRPPAATMKDLVGEIADSLASARCIQPRVVTEAPCQEVVIEGEGVNLLEEVPGMLGCELETDPAIYSGVVMAKEPDSGNYCLGAHYVKITGSRKLASFIAPIRRVRQYFDKAERLGRPLEVAVVIGVDPVLHMLSGASITYGRDKLEVACTVRGEPVEVVKCKTVDLNVPAHAEMVIEGRMLPELRETFGPFSDFWGFYVKSPPPQPVIEVTAITRRRAPVFPFIYVAYPSPPAENSYIPHVAGSAAILSNLRRILPGVRALNATLSSCCQHMIVSISKTYPGQPLQVMDAIWAMRPNVHTIVVVDDDVDPFNLSQVEWVMATHVSPCRDVFIIPEVAQSIEADTIGRKASRGTVISRMGIDATRDEDWDHELAAPHRERMKQVEAQWPQYFGGAPDRLWSVLEKEGATA
ncbi:MAG: UbiD family decarboxylase [Chloroflexota bacterium]